MHHGLVRRSLLFSEGGWLRRPTDGRSTESPIAGIWFISSVRSASVGRRSHPWCPPGIRSASHPRSRPLFPWRMEDEKEHEHEKRRQVFSAKGGSAVAETFFRGDCMGNAVSMFVVRHAAPRRHSALSLWSKGFGAECHEDRKRHSADSVADYKRSRVLAVWN